MRRVEDKDDFNKPAARTAPDDDVLPIADLPGTAMAGTAYDRLDFIDPTAVSGRMIEVPGIPAEMHGDLIYR
jgi:hypothetical protein